MAKISTYPISGNPTLSDKLIGSDPNDLNLTKNYTIAEILALGGGNTPSYKVYAALLTQSGTDAPIATVLENTLGVDPIWYYQNTGSYYIESFGTFIDGKTAVIMGPLQGNTWGEVSQTFGQYPDQVFILTFRVNVDNIMPSSLEPQNDVMNNTFIEIRVYN